MLAAVAALLGLHLLRRRTRDRLAQQGADDQGCRTAGAAGRSTTAERLILAVIAASLLAKLFLLTGVHAFVPSRNDDAVSIWLFKAKVVAGLDALPLDPRDDYYQGGSNPHYPILVPLMAAWIPMVTGTWHEETATLPWLFCYANMILLVAGGVRRWLTPVQSWIAAYLAASPPLMVIHAYRPGYADMILASFLAAAFLYLLSWRSSGLWRYLALAAGFALIAAGLKRESPVLAAIVLLAVLASSGRRVLAWTPRAAVEAAAILIAGVLVLWTVVDFSEQVEAAADLGYHAAVWAKLGQHLFEWSSFHFLFWGLAAAFVVAVRFRGAVHKAPAILAVIGLCGFHAVVFAFTPQARFALNDQTPSRLFMQIVPTLIVALSIPLATGLASPPRPQESPDGELGRRDIIYG
jgi:hypothetical protein